MFLNVKIYGNSMCNQTVTKRVAIKALDWEGLIKAIMGKEMLMQE